jgi:hypothetical protein
MADEHAVAVTDRRTVHRPLPPMAKKAGIESPSAPSGRRGENRREN